MKFSSKMMKSVTFLALLGSVALTGCAATTSSTSATTSISSSSSISSASSDSSASATAASTNDGSISYDTHFDSNDLTWDESSVKTIDLSNPTATDGVTVEDGVITITAAGDYKLSGDYSGQIVVNAGDEDVVRLILDNANITNDSGSAINIQNANEAIIYTTSGSTNTVSDGSTYSATGEDDPDAAIFSKSDLTLAGEGTLTVNGNYKNGIASSDGLVIANGTLNVTAKNNGIKGKDYVDILDGTINVKATEGDGIKSTNSTDEGRGWTRLQGGTVTINSGDNAFQAEKELEIDGGTLNVESSYEGMQGQYIIFNDGKVNITSSDDGINATAPDTTDTSSTNSSSTDSTSTDTTSSDSASSTDTSSNTSSDTQSNNQQQMTPPDMGSGQAPADMGSGQMPGGGQGGGMDTVEDASVTINGGTITVNAEGDGFDSNGTATINGGTLTINGPFSGGNGSFDVNGDYTVNGGTILAGGTSDMYVSPTSEKQGYLKITTSGVSEGDTVTVKDASGNEIATYTVTNSDTQIVTISSSQITAGTDYTVSVAGTDTTVTAS